jgi:hypothetical protein
MEQNSKTNIIIKKPLQKTQSMIKDEEESPNVSSPDTKNISSFEFSHKIVKSIEKTDINS